MSGDRPALPDGLVAVVKKDCETCKLVAPLLADIASRDRLAVFVQDDAAYFATDGVEVQSDDDLALSWHYAIDTVPTLIKVVHGEEVERTIGWSQDLWREMTGIDDLGEGLPAFRPGCGSMSVDPDRVDELAVRHGGTVLSSRRIEVASAEDPFEMMYDRGWSDGLPVVPPTEERVMAMLSGTDRAPGDVVATVPPDLVDATVEKVAIAAVMAGCLPEYLPWVLAAVEAACTDTFNMHGLLATTMPVGPVMVCSGPGTQAIGMNSGVNALGQGNRANSTIGRALQLVVRNVGGGRPGEIDRAAQGSPAKVGFCFAERPDSPFGTLAEQRGVAAGQDALTLFAGEGPRGIVDQISRTPESLAGTIAHQLQALHHHKLIFAFDAILVLGPEHGRVFADAGWDRTRIIDELMERVTTPASDLARGAGGIAEGIPAGMEGDLAKFGPDGLMIAYAGGGAGLFSSIIPGWINGASGSQPVSRPLDRPDTA